jgi:hypothetical protein
MCILYRCMWIIPISLVLKDNVKNYQRATDILTLSINTHDFKANQFQLTQPLAFSCYFCPILFESILVFHLVTPLDVDMIHLDLVNTYTFNKCKSLSISKLYNQQIDLNPQHHFTQQSIIELYS